MQDAYLEFSESRSRETHRAVAERPADERALEARIRAVAEYEPGAWELWEEIRKCPDGSSRWTGRQWQVAVSGRSTQYTKDEFGLVFTRGTGPDREQRVVRYSPLGAKSAGAVAGALSDAELARPAGRLAARLDRTRAGLPPLTATGDTAGRPARRPPRALDRIRREPGAGGRVSRARAAGLAAISLTDHDTVAGRARGVRGR